MALKTTTIKKTTRDTARPAGEARGDGVVDLPALPPANRSKRMSVPLQVTKEELASVLTQMRLTNDAVAVAFMLRVAYKTLWAALKSKYGLPDGVEMDHNTGEFTLPDSAEQK